MASIQVGAYFDLRSIIKGEGAMIGRRRWICVAAAFMSAGCASVPEVTDPNAPQACVVIDNSRGGGRHSRIFLQGPDGGSSELMGEVGPGKTLRLCTRRYGLPRDAVVVIQRPSTERMDPALNQNQPRPIRSPEFVLNAWDEWTWEVSLNRLILVQNGARVGG